MKKYAMKKFLGLSLISMVILAACSSAKAAASGQNLYFERGCVSCHARDNSYSIGPSWKGLYGSEVRLNDGSSVVADDAYLLESILDPKAKTVEGYTPGLMPLNGLTESEAKQLIEYIKTLR